MLINLGDDRILNTNTDYQYTYDPAAETLVIEGKLYYLLIPSVHQKSWNAIIMSCVKPVTLDEILAKRIGSPNRPPSNYPRGTDE